MQVFFIACFGESVAKGWGFDKPLISLTAQLIAQLAATNCDVYWTADAGPDKVPGVQTSSNSAN